MIKTAKRLIIICIIVLCACVFPISLIRKNVDIDFAMDSNYYEVTDYNTQDFKQTFIAQTSYLDEIAFDVGVSEVLGGGRKLCMYALKRKTAGSSLWKPEFPFRILMMKHIPMYL